MLKIGLLEDEQDQAERLIRFLEQYRTSHPDVVYELQRYSRAMELLDNYQRDCDLLFLDIRVPDMTGMDMSLTMMSGMSSIVMSRPSFPLRAMRTS